MKPGDWLTTEDAAALIGVSRDRVYALIRAGRLTPTRVGNQYLLLRADVVAFGKLPRVPGRPAKAKPAAKKKGGKK